MERKKVLLAAYGCSPIKGSEPGNGWSWATGLAAKGFEVWCFTNTEDQDEILQAVEKLNMPHLHFVFVKIPGFLDKFLLDTGSKKIYFHYALWKQQSARRAKRMHAVVKFDIAHHVSFGSLQQGNFLWKLKDLKIIFGPVGGGQKALPIFKEYFGKAWRRERIRNYISNFSTACSLNFKNSILNADYVLVNNQDTLRMAQRISANINGKLHSIPGTAVPLSMENIPFIERKPSKTLKLLWVGRVLPRKGLNLILESLSRLPKAFNYEFTIVGGGELFHMVESWIKLYGVERSRMNITGQISFEEVADYYRSSDVFIFCSLRETFGAQLMEAMAFGLPIITFNMHGAATGVPDNCGIKITPETKDQTLDDISKAVIKMYQDVDFRNQCGMNAFFYSKKNTWKQKIDSVISNFY